jgi:hypothetical protein
MAAKKQYSCPNRKCKKKITALVPSPEAVGKKGFWDGVTVCPHCGQAHFKRVWPGGKIVIVVEDISVEMAPSKDRMLKPGELADRAGISKAKQKELNSGVEKYMQEARRSRVQYGSLAKKRHASVEPLVKDGLYFCMMPGDQLVLVRALRQLKTKNWFKGVSIYSDDKFYRTGEEFQFDMSVFKFIPFNPTVYKLLPNLDKKNVRALVKELKEFATI